MPRNSCYLCNCDELRPRLSIDGMTVSICTGCNSGLVTAMSLESVELDGYSERYESERMSDKPSQCWEILQSCVPDLSGMSSLLDIGCGEGDFLDIALRNGLDVAGIDLSVRASSVAGYKGHKVVCGSIDDSGLALGERYDLCVMWDLLEHVNRPGVALENMTRFLNPGGKAVIATPMMGSIYDRLGMLFYDISRGRARKLLKMCWTREHLYRFNPAGLESVLSELGFVNISVKPVFMLSLDASCYAGGSVMHAWTPFDAINRVLSRTGVGIARALGFHNKILVCAQMPAQGSE